MVHRGRDIRRLRRLLGHDNINLTAVYLQFNGSGPTRHIRACAVLAKELSTGKRTRHAVLRSVDQFKNHSRRSLGPISLCWEAFLINIIELVIIIFSNFDLLVGIPFSIPLVASSAACSSISCLINPTIP